MTLQEIENIRLRKFLPKDELNGFEENIKGILPSVIILFAGLGPFIAKKTSVSIENQYIFLCIGLSVFLYTIYAKLIERKLKLTRTDLSKEQNSELIAELSQSESWNNMTIQKEFYAFVFPSVSFHNGFKVTLVPTDKGVLINVRNRGSIFGRMPYNFGLETILKRKIEKKLKKAAHNTQ